MPASELAREILADIVGKTVNDTTNTLTTKIIFGNDAKPQSSFNCIDIGDAKQSLKKWENELGICHKELRLPWNQDVEVENASK